MKLCFIGSTGHTGYALEGIKKEQIEIVGFAPGSEGEQVRDFYLSLLLQGYKPRFYLDYLEMIDELKPDIVVIASFFCDHARLASEALKRGIHVFVEKPLATNFADLQLLREIYYETKANMMGMFGLRYTPWFYTAWRQVKKGAIGEIRLMQARKSYKLGERGFHYQQREIYGGTIPWVGSHAIDWLYWFGGVEFREVYAAHSTIGNKNHGELEVTSLCQFKMEREIYASIIIDYLRPKEAPTHEDDRLIVVGTAGEIEVREQRVFLINERVGEKKELPLLQTEGIFSDFLKRITGQGDLLIPVDDPILVTEAALKARQSADEKRVIYF